LLHFLEVPPLIGEVPDQRAQAALLGDKCIALLDEHVAPDGGRLVAPGRAQIRELLIVGADSLVQQVDLPTAIIDEDLGILVPHLECLLLLVGASQLLGEVARCPDVS
jgi:hypothetical protein